MRPQFPTVRRTLFFCGLLTATCCGIAERAASQVSPNEILNPQLKSLERQYLPQLKAMNQEIAKTNFPFSFYLSRAVGLGPAQQVEADTRGLEFIRFRDRVVLKATGNYNAAYDARQFTRNERAARAFRDVMLPLLRIITKTTPRTLNATPLAWRLPTMCGMFKRTTILKEKIYWLWSWTAKMPSKWSWKKMTTPDRIF